MSTCISHHGEFSSHTLDPLHTCTFCGVLDEDTLRADLRSAKVEASNYAYQRDEARRKRDEAVAEVASQMLATGNAHLATAKVEDEVERLTSERVQLDQLCREGDVWLHRDQVLEILGGEGRTGSSLRPPRYPHGESQPDVPVDAVLDPVREAAEALRLDAQLADVERLGEARREVLDKAKTWRAENKAAEINARTSLEILQRLGEFDAVLAAAVDALVEVEDTPQPQDQAANVPLITDWDMPAQVVQLQCLENIERCATEGCTNAKTGWGVCEPVAAVDRDGEVERTVGTCIVCDQPVHLYDSPSGSWWSHDVHPEDGPDAALVASIVTGQADG